VAEQVKKMQVHETKEIIDNISLLHRSFQSQQPNSKEIVNGLFTSLVHRIANVYLSNEKSPTIIKKQSAAIFAGFKDMVLKHSFLHSPSFFADKLHVSTAYLNDCSNAATGQSITYWLQQAMVTEAQRQLYYTRNDVKEIAYNLGFQDAAYFSRLFKKITDTTPLEFRKNIRE